MSSNTLFQLCQKLVIFNEKHDKILLAKRKGEADYDGVYSFIGGKAETEDKDYVDSIVREKNEEIGVTARVQLYPLISYNVFFRKKDGNSMFLPHYYCVYYGGDIILSNEYSDYKWVSIADIGNFQPRIDTIESAIEHCLKIADLTSKADMVKL